MASIHKFLYNIFGRVLFRGASIGFEATGYPCSKELTSVSVTWSIQSSITKTHTPLPNTLPSVTAIARLPSIWYKGPFTQAIFQTFWWEIYVTVKLQLNRVFKRATMSARFLEAKSQGFQTCFKLAARLQDFSENVLRHRAEIALKSQFVYTCTLKFKECDKSYIKNRMCKRAMVRTWSKTS